MQNVLVVLISQDTVNYNMADNVQEDFRTLKHSSRDPRQTSGFTVKFAADWFMDFFESRFKARLEGRN